MVFGDKIKAARLAKRLKQSELAEMLGVSNTTISNWEKDVSKPDVDTFELLCGALGIAPNYLLMSGEASSPELIIPDELKGVQVAFHRGEFEDLTQYEVDRLAEFAKFLKTQREEGAKDDKT